MPNSRLVNIKKSFKESLWSHKPETNLGQKADFVEVGFPQLKYFP